jgi:hypothetical protein
MNAGERITGLSDEYFDRLERGGQIQSRSIDNFMRVLFDAKPVWRKGDKGRRQTTARQWRQVGTPTCRGLPCGQAAQ